jgi:hypothetical protein
MHLARLLEICLLSPFKRDVRDANHCLVTYLIDLNGPLALTRGGHVLAGDE